MDHHDPLGIIGTTIAEKYQVEKVVGEGGFGIVYRATHKIWKQPVAIKCFKVLMEISPEVRDGLLKDFIQEGALLTQLSGRTASIVQARDVGTFTTATGAWVPYMVLEWLDGRTLEAIVEQEREAAGRPVPWPAARAIRVLEPVATALDLVHRRGIAHRDIKPANIFVSGHVDDDDMIVKVLDFGIAKVVQSAADHGSFTKTGGMVTSFTPGYGAPEQFSRAQGATGAWTDVYALALVLSELLAGVPPLQGDDFIQLGIASADPARRPTPRTLGADVNEELEACLRKALAVKPQERYGTAGEFWNAVRQSQKMATITAMNPSARGTTGAMSGSNDAKAPAPALGAAATVAVASPTFSTMTGSSSTTPRGVAAISVAEPAKRSMAGWIAVGALGLAGVAGWALFGRGAGGDKGSAGASLPGPLSSALAAAPPSSAAAASASAAAALAPKGCPPDMATIDGGKFFMGSDEKDADEDERPAHQVTLSSYCIDRKEVTVAQYKACSDMGECKRAPFEVDWKDITPKEKRVFSPLCNGDEPEKAAHPINCVDWSMADGYCKAQKKRLPTEAEWEFSARGPDGRRYPWGDEPPDKRRMNACGKECLVWGAKNGVEMGVRGKGMYPDDDGYFATAPVGSFPEGRSRYGLLDVVGNVWEWTSDWETKYKVDAQVDPHGPESGERRVVRGGAFNGAMPSWVRPSQRYSDLPDTHSHAYGFRCAKSQ